MSTARTRANNKYTAKAYDRLSVFLKKGEREKLQNYVRKRGMSVNGYFVYLLQKDMAENPLPEAEEAPSTEDS